MIEQPVKLDQYAELEEALQIFRLQHMRHLLVVSPLDGSLVGIVTRKDLDNFMNFWATSDTSCINKVQAV